MKVPVSDSDPTEVVNFMVWKAIEERRFPKGFSQRYQLYGGGYGLGALLQIPEIMVGLSDPSSPCWRYSIDDWFSFFERGEVIEALIEQRILDCAMKHQFERLDDILSYTLQISVNRALRDFLNGDGGKYRHVLKLSDGAFEKLMIKSFFPYVNNRIEEKTDEELNRLSYPLKRSKTQKGESKQPQYEIIRRLVDECKEKHPDTGGATKSCFEQVAKDLRKDPDNVKSSYYYALGKGSHRQKG